MAIWRAKAKEVDCLGSIHNGIDLENPAARDVAGSGGAGSGQCAAASFLMRCVNNKH